MFATYKKCPRMFKYQYIDKLGEKFRKPQPFFSLGNSIHGTLAKYVLLKPQERTGERLQEMLSQEWITEGYLNRDQEQEFFHRATDMLNDFHRSGFWKEDPDHVEKWFELPVDDFTLIGRIDWIRGNRVVDYKTGNFVPKAKELESDFQAIIYTLAAEHITGAAVKEMTFYYLGPGEKVSVSKSSQQLESDVEDVKKIVAAIRNDSDFFPTPHRIWCLYCDFNCICPLAGAEIRFADKDRITEMMMEGAEQAYHVLYEILGVSTT